MPLCRFDDSYAMFGATPVENLFLEEFMPRAPGDCVKVYLYGLKLCQDGGKEMSLSAVAKALALEENQVVSAFAYWERKGLLRRLSDRPVSYAYVNLQKALLEGRLHGGDQLLPYQDFNNALQDIFGDRLLHAEDYQRIYSIVEDMELPQEVVLLLCEHMTKTAARKQKVSLSQIEREARIWLREGIQTRESALDYMRTKSASYEGARAVVRQFGQRRAPTLDEETLYQKWTQDWGFTLEGVLLACAETTKIQNPSFAYVDAVLRSKYEQNAVSADKMLQSREQRDAQVQALREVLSALGLPRQAATDDLLQLHGQWLALGFDQATLCLLAKYLLRRGRGSIQSLDEAVQALKRQNLTGEEQIRAHLNHGTAQRQTLEALFRAAGIRRAPTPIDQKTLESWQAGGASMELMLLAAEYARHAQDPFAMMNKILSDWLKDGVADVKAARDEHAARREGAPAGRTQGARPGGFNDYPQRSYTDEEMEAIYSDLDALLAEEDKAE